MTQPPKWEDVLKGNTVVTALQERPEHAKRIAMVIGAWASIEHALIYMLSGAIQTKPHVVPKMMYAVQSSSARLEAISAALLQLMPDGSPHHEELREILKRAKQVLTIRNKYAHAVFGYGATEDGTPTLAIIRIWSDELHEQVYLHDLDHLLTRAKILSRHISRLDGALRGLPPVEFE